jgi:large subunit ribosomal protein L11
MNVKLLVDGGAMKPGPAVSQKLGPAGININEVISKVNEATANFKGMQVPVEVNVNTSSKTFEVEVFSPPISGMLKKEAGINKGSGIQSKLNSANLSIEQVIKVANSKLPNLLCKDLKSAVKVTVGSCATLGMLIENKPAVEIETDIESGVYDKEIESISIETSEEKRKELNDYFVPLRAQQEKLNKPAEDDGKKKKKK